MYTKKYRIITLGLLSVFTLWMAYSGFKQYQTINTLLDTQILTPPSIDDKSLEIGDLRITKASVQDFDQPDRRKYGRTFVSVTNLDHQTPSPQLDNTLLNLSQRQQNRTIYGLWGYPSFLVSPDDLSFWRSQLYLQILFYFGGLAIIGIFFILFYELNYRKDNKLFVPAIKNVILGLSILFSGGAILKWGLDFRLYNFLNDQFYFGEPLPPIDNNMIFLGGTLLFTAIILQRAVELQKEQDLTI
ncbi:hypothetical protein [Fodinibius sp.]|uniref:hypothetical protein n=1 Tax=Fodinibius sp. TaxID=1872440 RepID=UPI002ACEDB19|nr:hypothetical protein [Fodinibius sp.]MDZ7658952.1 hypothetical protein [Fodinibius sp.]